MPHRRTVLVVEDDANDALLMRLAFERAGLGGRFQRVSDATEAMRYLAGTDCYADRAAHPFPVLLVVDLKLPGISGWELLTWVRADPRFKHLPVVLNSSSRASKEVQRTVELGASKFLTKTPGFKELVDLVKEHPTPPSGSLWTLAPNRAAGNMEGSRAARLSRSLNDGVAWRYQ